MKKPHHGAGEYALPLIAAVLVLSPLAAALWASRITGEPLRWPGLPLALATFAWTGAVATLATLLGIPGAAVVASRGARAAPLVLTPLLLPTYLAYSGYSLLRAPGAPLGDALARLSAAGNTAPAAMAGRITAVIALALWAWPIASLVLGAWMRRLDPATLDALDLDAPAHRRIIERARMSAPGFLGAWTLVLLVMLGSAVPFNLAQVNTSAIVVWLELQQTSQPLRAWITAWPVVGVGIGAAWWLSGRLQRSRDLVGFDARTPRRAGRFAWAGLVLAWTLSVIVPLVLYAVNLSEPAALGTFWTLCGEAVLSSALVAGAVGAIVACVAIFTGASMSERRSPLVRASVFVLLVAGLTPGILVGSAWAVASLHLPAWLGDSSAMVVCAHAARFAFVGVVGGALIAASEAKELTDARRVEGATGLLAWLSTCGRANGALIGACGLAGAALSFHEIEAAVLVRPPGMDSLAQRLLNDLHQLRMDAMSAAAIWLTLMGLVGAASAGWLVSRWGGRR